MSLDEDQKEMVREWVRQWEKRCSVCSGEQFDISGIHPLPTIDDEELKLYKFVPVIALVCENCRAVSFVAAAGIGFEPGKLKIPRDL